MSTLSPTQRAKLRTIVEAFDVALDRERARWGASSAEQMRARVSAWPTATLGSTTGGRTPADRRNGGCSHG